MQRCMQTGLKFSVLLFHPSPRLSPWPQAKFAACAFLFQNETKAKCESCIKIKRCLCSCSACWVFLWGRVHIYTTPKTSVWPTRSHYTTLTAGDLLFCGRRSDDRLADESHTIYTIFHQSMADRYFVQKQQQKKKEACRLGRRGQWDLIYKDKWRYNAKKELFLVILCAGRNHALFVIISAVPNKCSWMTS